MTEWHDVETVDLRPDDREVDVVFGDGVVIVYHVDADTVEGKPSELIGRLGKVTEAVAPFR